MYRMPIWCKEYQTYDAVSWAQLGDHLEKHEERRAGMYLEERKKIAAAIEGAATTVKSLSNNY